MSAEGMLANFKQDVSHQEMGRIVSEIEELFFASQASTLPVESIEHYLMNDLGYDDQDEFEDALHGTFEAFLRSLPNCTVSKDSEGKLVFAMHRRETAEPQKLELSVKSRDELWRIFLFAPAPAKVVIPEVEFEIQGPAKNTIDSIYNHLARAITNLEQHAEMNDNGNTMLIAAITELKELLDLERPFTWVVEDPNGVCEINPSQDVKVSKLES